MTSGRRVDSLAPDSEGTLVENPIDDPPELRELKLLELVTLLIVLLLDLHSSPDETDPDRSALALDFGLETSSIPRTLPAASSSGSSSSVNATS
jgi:hypothetical protein